MQVTTEMLNKGYAEIEKLAAARGKSWALHFVAQQEVRAMMVDVFTIMYNSMPPQTVEPSK